MTLQYHIKKKRTLHLLKPSIERFYTLALASSIWGEAETIIHDLEGIGCMTPFGEGFYLFQGLYVKFQADKIELYKSMKRENKVFIPVNLIATIGPLEPSTSQQ